MLFYLTSTLAQCRTYRRCILMLQYASSTYTASLFLSLCVHGCFLASGEKSHILRAKEKKEVRRQWTSNHMKEATDRF
jgi:hypothetical protein